MDAPSKISRLLLVLLACLAAANTRLLAQEPPSLAALLEQLRAATPAAWQARAAAMVDAAVKARADAEAKRAEAKAEGELSASKAAAAKAVLAEVDKLAQLRALVAALSFRDVAGGEPQDERSRLERALAELRAAGDATWQARTAAMQAEREALERAAAVAKQAQDACVAAAMAKDAEAAMLDAERQRLAQLQQLVASLQLPAAQAVDKAADPAAEMRAAKPAGMPVDEPAGKPAEKPVEKPAAESAGEPTGKPTEKPTEPQPPAGDGKQAMAQVSADERLLTYRDDVYPIFDANCIDCHDVSEASGGLDLSSYASLRQGGGSGRTLKPGDPDGSRLYLLVAHKEKPTMPPDEPRIDAQLIETIRTWIAQGAPEDAAAARGLASARAMAQQKEAARKAAAPAPAEAAAAKPAVAVMPEELPRVAKAWPMRPGALRAVAASPLAPLLAVPGHGQVLLLHQDDLRELAVLPFPSGQVEVLAFAEHGASLLAAGGTAGQRGEAVLYDVRTGRSRGGFGAQADAVLAAAVAPDASLVATGGTRRRLDVFRVADGELAWQTGHDEWVTAVAFSPDGRLCASADRAGNVQVREAATGREVHTFAGAEAAVTALAFSPDAELLATAGGDGGVATFRMSDARRVFRQQAHRDEVLCLSWRSGSRLVSGGADGRLMYWKSDGNREAELPRLDEWVYGVAATPDGARVFAVDWQGRLSAIDVAERKVLGMVQPLAVTQ